MDYKLIIDRTTWLRAEPQQSSLKRKSDGKKCCIGFDAIRRGYTEAEIEGIGSPAGLNHASERFSDLVAPRNRFNDEVGHLTRAKDLCFNLMKANDDGATSDAAKEERITKLYATIGVIVQFIN